jgi:ribonuclease P/MRP protein subunit POP5
MVRIKHRYLLINILYPTEPPPGVKLASEAVPDFVRFNAPSPADFLSADLARLIRAAIVDLAGDYGAATTANGLKGLLSPLPVHRLRSDGGRDPVIYHSPATSTAIVRVAREQHRLARAALALVARLPRPWRTPCVVRVARVSGTVRKAEEAAVEAATGALRRARSVAEGGGAAGLDWGLLGLEEVGRESGAEDEDGGEDEDGDEDEDEDEDGEDGNSSSEMDAD